MAETEGRIEMIAFEIVVNGERAYVLGVGDLEVATVAIQWAKIETNLPGATQGRFLVHGVGLKGDAEIRVGDVLCSGTHFMWPQIALNVGDEVTIRVVEAAACDPGSEFPLGIS